MTNGDLASAFQGALQTAEREKSLEAVLAFFGEGSSLRRLNHKDYTGKEGAERFWREYLGTFETQETSFHTTTLSAERVVLEWTSEGKLANGKPFAYSGVSILEGSGDKVKSFRTYYDSAVFVNEEALTKLGTSE